MAGISGQGTTFNLPNYVGELFALSREDTPFLSAIGGLTGGKQTTSTMFQWQTYDLRSSTAGRVALEGAAAPTAGGRVRANITNVVEIHHEAVDISYTKLAATGQLQDVGSAHPEISGIVGTNPVQNESAWQIAQELKAMAHDINESFINGTFVEPANNSTARKTRGILEAITTNVVDAQGYALDDTVAPGNTDVLGDLMQMIYDNGGIRESDTRTLVTNSTQKRKITSLLKGKGYEQVPPSRNMGGVNVTSIETDFGKLNIMLEPSMPQDEVLICSLEEIVPVFLLIPDKGFLFVEPLAKTGASESAQLYGEVGLEYGVEKHHGKITNLATVDAS